MQVSPPKANSRFGREAALCMESRTFELALAFRAKRKCRDHLGIAVLVA
jgi:hypothetical protein